MRFSAMMYLIVGILLILNGRWILDEQPSLSGLVLGGTLGILGLQLFVSSSKPDENLGLNMMSLFICLSAIGLSVFYWSLGNIAGRSIWFAGALSITIPFHLGTLYFVSKLRSDPFYREARNLSFEQCLNQFTSQRGASLKLLSEDGPTLVIFLRHSGCTFCRDMLGELETIREEIESQGCSIALVHMSSPLNATKSLHSTSLGDIHRFSDPHCVMYRAFSIPRGGLMELLGPKVWLKGLAALFLRGRGMGKIDGDSFQLPGVFLIHQGEIVKSHRASHSADTPDFVEFVRGRSSDVSEGDAVAVQAQ